MSEKRVFPFAKFLFFAFCFSVVFYLTCKEIKRYIDNEDTSSIAFQKFNSSPRDLYPVISLCFYGRYGRYSTIYKEELLNDKGYNTSQYWNLITGNSNATPEEIKNMPDFSSVTINLEQLTLKFQTINERDEFINKMGLENYKKPPSKNNSLIPLMNGSYWPFYLSYQNPNQVCYSQYSNFTQGLIKFVDFISLDKDSLNDLQNSGFLYMYVHYPGHTIRSFGKEVFSVMLNKYNTKKRMVIRISGVSVLRRRSDAQMRCNPNVEDEDIDFRNYVMIKVGCIPPYWNSFDNLPDGLQNCVTNDQLKKVYNYSRYGNVRNILEQHDPPCSEMTVSSSVDHQYSGDLNLNFQYRSDEYLETTNKRDFGARNLWSSVGGFIGIFLGFSLFQLVEVLMSRACWFMDEKLNQPKLIKT